MIQIGNQRVATIQLTSFPPHGIRYMVIHWEVHMKVFEGYAKKYGHSQSAERIAERGGFGINEVKEFYPEWDGVVLCASEWYDDINKWTKIKF